MIQVSHVYALVFNLFNTIKYHKETCDINCNVSLSELVRTMEFIIQHDRTMSPKELEDAKNYIERAKREYF